MTAPTIDHASPTPVQGVRDAVELAAGATYACIRRATGAVTCWTEPDDLCVMGAAPQ